MNKNIAILKQTRQHVLSVIEGLSTDDLNDTPSGFNNNIVWHLGHMIVSQQGVCYRRGGVSMIIPDELFEQYKPGTRPERYIDESEIQQFKTQLLSLVDKLSDDYDQQLFSKYSPWTTRYGVELSNIEDTLSFLLFHEGLHLGYIMAIKKLVTKE